MDKKEKLRLKKMSLRKWKKIIKLMEDVACDQDIPCGYCTIHDGVCERCEMMHVGMCGNTVNTVHTAACDSTESAIESMNEIKIAIMQDIDDDLYGKEEKE